MQAIIAKYMPATNYKPSRVKASCERGSIVVSYDDGSGDGGWGSEAPFRRAVDALCKRFDAEDLKKYGSAGQWTGPKTSGQIPSGEWVFCFVPQEQNGGVK